jgi:carbonic anhydrase
MDRIIPVRSRDEVPAHLRDTPFEVLLRTHNLQEEFARFESAQLLIGMCMDHRNLPENFAYVLRAGGGNLRYSEFKVSYAIAVGGARAIALFAHTNCGMVNLQGRREAFVNGLVQRAGWERSAAEDHFMNFAPMFEMGNAIDFVVAEAQRLRARYPLVPVAPMLYRVEDGLLYPLRESPVEIQASPWSD